jgi:hypothetical protein
MLFFNQKKSDVLCACSWVCAIMFFLSSLPGLRSVKLLPPKSKYHLQRRSVKLVRMSNVVGSATQPVHNGTLCCLG